MMFASGWPRRGADRGLIRGRSFTAVPNAPTVPTVTMQLGSQIEGNARSPLWCSYNWGAAVLLKKALVVFTRLGRDVRRIQPNADVRQCMHDDPAAHERVIERVARSVCGFHEPSVLNQRF